MINKNDLAVIWEHSNSIHENETQFQTMLKTAFYEVARKDLFYKDIGSFLEGFEISASTLWRWMQGTSVPHSNIQDLVVVWWEKQMMRYLK